MAITLHVETLGNREAVLDRRDEIIDALRPLGIRVSLINNGTEVYLADAGVPILNETIFNVLDAMPDIPVKDE